MSIPPQHDAITPSKHILEALMGCMQPTLNFRLRLSNSVFRFHSVGWNTWHFAEGHPECQTHLLHFQHSLNLIAYIPDCRQDKDSKYKLLRIPQRSLYYITARNLLIDITTYCIYIRMLLAVIYD